MIRRLSVGFPIRIQAGRAVSGRDFWVNVIRVLRGAALAQAIPVLGSLVLARLFAPAEFGVFATWLGSVSVVAIAVTGRYEMALALEPDGAPRLVAVRAILVVIGAGTAALLLIATLLLVITPGVFGAIPITLVAAAAPAAGLTAASQTWQCWAAAEGRYAALTAIRICQAFAITVSQIAAGVLHPTASSLGLAQSGGLLAGLAVAAFLLPLDRSGAWAQERRFLARHRRFPALSLAADSISTAGAQMPLFLVTSRFGAEAAGLLALAMRTLGAPIALLGAAVLDVFRQRAASAYRERGNCRQEYVSTAKGLAASAVIAGVILALSSRRLFSLAFGPKWAASGIIALWLLPLFSLRFVASPLSYTFYIAGEQRLDLAWQCVLFAVVLATLWFPSTYGGALQAYSLGYSAMYLAYLALSYHLSGGRRS